MNIYDKIIERYQPEVDENNMVKIVPLSKFEWKVSEISDEDNIMLITLDDFVCLTQHYAQFNAELNAIIPFDKTEFKEFLKSKGYTTSKEN